MHIITTQINIQYNSTVFRHRSLTYKARILNNCTFLKYIWDLLWSYLPLTSSESPQTQCELFSREPLSTK